MLAGLIGIILAAACLVGAFLALQRKRIIDDLPTSKTQGVFIGIAELLGTAESDSPFTSHFAGIRCVHYSWQIEEHWSKTVTETITDNKGHMQTRTRTESGWKQIAAGGESAPFYLQDDTGVIRIVPEGAKIQSKSVFSVTCQANDPLYFGQGPLDEIPHTTHRRRFIETALPLHTRLYVLGQARERQDIVAAEIARDKNNSMFIISVLSEKQISRGYSRWWWFFLTSGLLCALGGGIGWTLLSAVEIEPGWNSLIAMAGGYIILLFLTYLWTTYNNLINLHHRVEQAWSQVNVQVKRRHDLIPNLVTIVEEYLKYESEMQNTLTEIRGQKETEPADEGYHALSTTLRIISERYPDLKANSTFIKLQEALVNTEERIALARDYYNNIVTFYRNRLEMVPERYVGNLARLHKPDLIRANDFERASVVVKMSD